MCLDETFKQKSVSKKLGLWFETMSVKIENIFPLVWSKLHIMDIVWPSTAILSLSSCCSRLWRSSSSNSRALRTWKVDYNDSTSWQFLEQEGQRSDTHNIISSDSYRTKVFFCWTNWNHCCMRVGLSSLPIPTEMIHCVVSVLNNFSTFVCLKSNDNRN